MTYQRTPYDDAESTQAMSADCHEVEHNLHLGHRAIDDISSAQPLRAPGRPSATSRLRTNYEVSDDLARRASGLELHFD